LALLGGLGIAKLLGAKCNDLQRLGELAFSATWHANC
jgi:hypothetical protein